MREQKDAGKGQKLDKGKPMWDLLDLSHIEEIVEVLTFGAEKYKPNNWKLVPDRENRYFAAMMRHITAYRKGEVFDKETGMRHLAHAGCCLYFLMHFEFEKENKNVEQRKI